MKSEICTVSQNLISKNPTSIKNRTEKEEIHTEAFHRDDKVLSFPIAAVVCCLIIILQMCVCLFLYYSVLYIASGCHFGGIAAIHHFAR